MDESKFEWEGEGILERSSLASCEERFLLFQLVFVCCCVEKLSELTGARRKSVPPFLFCFEGQVAVRFS